MNTGTCVGEILEQFDRAFELFRQLALALPDECWLPSVDPIHSPRRWGIHAVQSVDVYLNLRPEDVDRTDFKDWEGPLDSLPDRQRLLEYAAVVQQRLRAKWEGQPDEALMAPTAFEWTGSTRLGQLGYGLRHFMFHLGEMAMLLRQKGATEAPWR